MLCRAAAPFKPLKRWPAAQRRWVNDSLSIEFRRQYLPIIAGVALSRRGREEVVSIFFDRVQGRQHCRRK